MSLYRKYAQGPVVKTAFTLSTDNIDEYEGYARALDKAVRTSKSIRDLKARLAKPETQDELFTESYIKARLLKLEEFRTPLVDSLMEVQTRLDAINEELNTLCPIVFTKSMTEAPEAHARMSELDQARLDTEEEVGALCAVHFADLKENLPKIFYMLVEGCNWDTVQSCFRQMKLVMCNGLTTEQAAAVLMDESSERYGLNKAVWDPIRMNKK